MKTSDDLANGWNGMGTVTDEDGNNRTVSIDYVIINTHADPTKLVGQDAESNWWYFNEDDIAALDNKEVKQNVLLYGCNAGHLDYKESNPAANFAAKAGNALLIASDGTVSMKDSDGFYNLKADASFAYWTKHSAERDNKGWIVYQDNGKKVTTRIADSGSKKLSVLGGCMLLY